VAQYQTFIDGVITKLNAKCAQKFQVEQPFLQALPRYRTADYEVLSARVSAHSTITLEDLAPVSRGVAKRVKI
jgi:hypothetical protein